jgi:hypothetical protein
MTPRKILLVLLALPVGLWLAGELAARWYLSEAMESGWPTPSGRLAAVVDLFPPQPANAAARTLEAEAWPLGIDIYPRTGPERPANLGTLNAQWKAIDTPAKTYLVEMLRQARSAPQPAPAPVAAFLLEHEGAIQHLAQTLIANDPPTWRVDVKEGFDAPLPNLLGNLHVVRLLALSALQHAARNEPEPAWRDLHAATRLPEGLFRRPDTISQLIAIAETSVIVGTMRQLSGPPPKWALTWPGEDLQKSLGRSFALDAWYGYSSFASPITTDLFTAFAGKETQPSLGGRMLSMLLSPYLRMSAANSAAAHRTVLRHNLEPPPCDQTVQALTTAQVIPEWNTFGRVAVPVESIGSSYRRLRGLHAHIEGTRLLLQARRARSQTGVWPGEPPPIVSPCAKRMWSYTATADGIRIESGATIPPLEAREALNLAMQFEE